MRGPTTPSAIVLSLVIGATLAAQDKPDFSGRWILEAPTQIAPDIPGVLAVRQSLVRTTVGGDPMTPFFKDIAIDREFENGTRSETREIGVVGGIVPGVRADGTSNGGPREHHAVSWDEDALVFESGSYTGETAGTGAWTERREVWSLDAKGHLRVVITTRGSSAGANVVTLVYRRSRS